MKNKWESHKNTHAAQSDESSYSKNEGSYSKKK